MKIFKSVWLFGCGGLFLLPRLLWAVETMAGGNPETDAMDTAGQFGPPSVDFTWLFLKTILAMVLVIALAVIILRFLLPKLSLNRIQKGEGTVQILERFPLDHKKMLYVLQVEDRRLLVGSTEHQVNLITELDSEKTDREN